MASQTLALPLFVTRLAHDGIVERTVKQGWRDVRMPSPLPPATMSWPGIGQFSVMKMAEQVVARSSARNPARVVFVLENAMLLFVLVGLIDGAVRWSA